jgi:response regulator RpfG family c-di-GMP phosphodiesterase
MSSAEASALMAQGSGSHFDPEVLEVFMLAVPVPAPFAA